MGFQALDSALDGNTVCLPKLLQGHPGDGDVISDDDAVHKVQETLWRLPQKQPR